MDTVKETKEGYSAYNRGEARKTNPYNKYSENLKWEDWNNGWDKADDDTSLSETDEPNIDNTLASKDLETMADWDDDDWDDEI